MAVLLLLGFVVPGGWGRAQAPQLSEQHAALLYATYCRGCHSEQVHWRDARRAKNWQLLVAEVRRWQENLGLAWTEDDIRQVAHYLNVRYYRFVPPKPKIIVEAGQGAAPADAAPGTATSAR